jgi:hypothetical protein
MATRDWISRVLLKKGKSLPSSFVYRDLLTCVISSFGWVNASYVYGLQIVNAHMRRALGTLTPYDTFIKAVEENRNKALAELV